MSYHSGLTSDSVTWVTCQMSTYRTMSCFMALCRSPAQHEDLLLNEVLLTTAILCLPILVFFISFLSFLIFLQTIEANWRCGRHNLQRIQCRSENSKGVYCLQYDDDKIISGLRDNSIKVCVHWTCRYFFHLNTYCIVDEVLCTRLHNIIVYFLFTMALLSSKCNSRYAYTDYF